MKNDNTSVDIDFAEAAVPHYARRGIVTMFMIMLGFTFFSASMWVGKELADGLDFGGFIISMIIGGLILSLYTGLLGYVGAETGLSLDLLARKAFGAKGSYLPSAMISFTQIGWFGVGIAMFAIPVANELLGGSTAAEWVLVIIAGVCMTASAYFGIKSLTLISYIAVPLVAILGTVAMVMAVKQGNGTLIDQFAKSSGTLTVVGGAGLVIGSFVSGGTATPNFSRFARNGKVGAITTVIAFFIGNSLMFFFGGISSVYVGGNDIFEVMINLGLFYLAILVLGLNIWTTNDNALYTAGLGLANIFGQRKKPMVLISGIVGTVLSVWLYWNFCGWLNILNCTLPPVGIILVMSFFMNREKYNDMEITETVNWFAVIGVLLGAVVANLVPWGIASINGMIVAAVCYLVGSKAKKKAELKKILGLTQGQPNLLTLRFDRGFFILLQYENEENIQHDIEYTDVYCIRSSRTDRKAMDDKGVCGLITYQPCVRCAEQLLTRKKQICKP